MDEILKKRIEEAASEGSKRYDPNVSQYSLGKNIGYIRGFMDGAEFMLSNQWVNIKDRFSEENKTL